MLMKSDKLEWCLNSFIIFALQTNKFDGWQDMKIEILVPYPSKNER